MDAAAIRNCIAATLDADADARRRAELQLKQVRLCCPGWMLDGVLDGCDMCAARQHTHPASSTRCATAPSC